MTALYPLRFQEILRNYSFGNRWIVSAFEKGPFPADHRVAETWEVCDRPGESSTVVNGPLAGATLHDLIERFGADLLGQDVVARCGTRFPLLIKLLDVSNPLAEQAHHSDELAQAQGLPDPGKTEAWYMLRTLPGATIHCGAKPGLTPEAALQAILNGSSRELMREYPVQPGDAFLLHAGTMHYSQGGMIFYEIMQNSDVYIGLQPPNPDLPAAEREAQARAALEGISLDGSFDPHIQPVTLQEGSNTRTFAFACRYFALERLDLSDPLPPGLRRAALLRADPDRRHLRGDRRRNDRNVQARPKLPAARRAGRSRPSPRPRLLHLKSLCARPGIRCRRPAACRGYL